MALFNFNFRETPQEREQKAIEAARLQYQGLLGFPATNQLAPQEGPVRPGETLLPIQQTTQGSGLLGGQISPQEFIGRTAGMPGTLGPNTINAVKEGLLGNSQAAPFGGTGMDAQTYNKLIQYNQKKQAGVPTTQTEDMSYNLAYQRAGRPQRFMDPSGQMIEYPGADLTGFAVPSGLSKKDREILGKKPKAAESAGKLAMMDTARQGATIIEPILFKGDAINTDAIKGAWAISNFEPSAALASPEAQQLANAYEIGIQAITRVETGAAMPAAEVRNTRRRFLPKPWDSDSVVRQKWTAYNLFLDNASEYLEPNKDGTWKVNVDKALQDAAPKTGQQKIIDFKDLP